MNKKYVVYSFVISFVLALILGFFMPERLVYRQDNISIDVVMRSNQDTEIKLFYMDLEDDGFAETKCISQKIKASEELQTYSFDLPTKEIKAIRLDCDVAVTQWDIQEIIVYTNPNIEILNAKRISEFSKNDVQVELKEGVLSLNTGDVDPYIFDESHYATQPDMKINFRYLVILVSFLAFFVVLLCNRAVIVDMVRGVYCARKQIVSLAFSDFKSRFSGSYLGMFWGVAQPIMTILLFWFVFQVGFRSQPISNAPFLLWLVAGMIPWNFFSDAWLNGNGAFTGYSYIVKKLVFNIDILPLVKVLASAIMSVIFNLIIIIVYALYGRMPVLHVIDMVYFSLCLTALALGLSMITATMNVFMKDVGQFLNIAMQFIMWLTPIMWDYHMIPEALSWAYKLNPLYYVTNGYREALIEGHWFSHNYYQMLWFWFVTITVNIIGIRLMKKLKPHFADVL